VPVANLLKVGWVEIGGHNPSSLAVFVWLDKRVDDHFCQLVCGNVRQHQLTNLANTSLGEFLALLLCQALGLEALNFYRMVNLGRAAHVEANGRGGLTVAIINGEEVVVPPLHTCLGQGPDHACVDEREVGALESAPAALLHGGRGAAGHHVQAAGIVRVE